MSAPIPPATDAEPPPDLTAPALAALDGPGYAVLTPSQISLALAQVEPDALAGWPVFADSWNRLVRDNHMADGGRYRFRRHGVYAADGVARPTALPRAPHYQATEYNRLNGGIERWFEPLEPAVADGATLRGVLALCTRWAGLRHPLARWYLEVHQFRIVAEPAGAGLPTPEGVHRDGVDYVLVMMVRRENIASGRTDLYESGRPVASFTLTEPRAAVLLDDRRLAHGVTPVTPVDPARDSYRDVLVVTLRDTTRG